MTQDTRKDRRVKIVSLNVRYKSATVDEFIDNHSYDVSRGGIYIKTQNPFPPGTLLKFEIRLSGDQSLIAGVGRVVWKRDTTQGTPERPTGMGVKFIKLDDASRAVIEKLVTSKADAGKGFESEQPEGPGLSTPPPRTATVIGMATSSPPSSGPIPSSPPVSVRTGGKVPAHTPPMFPAVSEAPPPVESAQARPEPTMMKQAAALLEEALKEAGGSMEEIGQNPIFAPAKPASEPQAVEDDLPATKVKDDLPAVKSKGDLPAVKSKTAAVKGSDPKLKEEAPKKAEATKKAEPVPATTTATTTRESPSAKHVAEKPSPAKLDKPSEAAQTKAKDDDLPKGIRGASAAATAPAPEEKKSSPKVAILVLLAAALAGGAFIFRGAIFGGGEQANPSVSIATQSAAPPPIKPSATVATASASIAKPAVSAAPSASVSASPSASAASSASAAAADPPKPPKPPPETPKPPPETPKPPPETPKPPPDPPKPPAPKPPAPKPADPGTDNPY